MNIATITCHDVYNYGASLQAFALQDYLERNGHSVIIIDYKPDYLNAKYRLSWYINPNSKYYCNLKNNVLLRLAYIIRRFCSQLKTIKRKKAFDLFTKNYLKLSNIKDSYRSLCKNPPNADLYIVGSDQVWNNSTLENGWDAAFYLQFGNPEVRRISYAASFGGKISIDNIVKKWLFSLDKITVREQSAISILEQENIDAVEVCDPVFLLSKREWIQSLSLATKSESYILVYNLDNKNARIMEDAKLLSRLTGLKIKYIVTDKKYRGIFNLNNLSPQRFLEEIYNADFVLSDSFHATAFSLIFKKEFFTYTFKTEQSSVRMTNILKKVNLLRRFNCADLKNEMNCPINYAEINSSLENYIQRSSDLLKSEIAKTND